MEIRPGVRLRSATSPVEVIVVRAPEDLVLVSCGGAPMLPVAQPVTLMTPLQIGLEDTVELGKRYIDDASGTELLCTKAGVGTLCCGDRPMQLKQAKPLPSSD